MTESQPKVSCRSEGGRQAAVCSESCRQASSLGRAMTAAEPWREIDWTLLRWWQRTTCRSWLPSMRYSWSTACWWRQQYTSTLLPFTAILRAYCAQAMGKVPTTSSESAFSLCMVVEERRQMMPSLTAKSMSCSWLAARKCPRPTAVRRCLARAQRWVAEAALRMAPSTRTGPHRHTCFSNSTLRSLPYEIATSLSSLAISCRSTQLPLLPSISHLLPSPNIPTLPTPYSISTKVPVESAAYTEFCEGRWRAATIWVGQRPSGESGRQSATRQKAWMLVKACRSKAWQMRSSELRWRKLRMTLANYLGSPMWKTSFQGVAIFCWSVPTCAQATTAISSSRITSTRIMINYKAG